jgi:uncharacterized membrane protein
MKLYTKFLPLFLFALLTLVSIPHISIFIQTQDVKSIAYVYIDNDGVAYINMSYKLFPGLNEVPLPTTPIIPSLTVEVNNKELPAIYNYTSNCLIIISEAEGVCIISFIANTTLAEGRLALNLSSKYMYRLFLSPQVILLTLPNNVTSFGTVNELYYIDFNEERDFQLLYIVKPRLTPTPAPNKPPATGIPLHIVIATLGAGIASVIAFFLLRVFRARREGEGIALSDLDAAILKCLEKRGGSALQSELQKDLPAVPRTTLWRHVKKLERLGYVKIEKVGQQNRVVMVKRFR